MYEETKQELKKVNDVIQASSLQQRQTACQVFRQLRDDENKKDDSSKKQLNQLMGKLKIGLKTLIDIKDHND